MNKVNDQKKAIKILVFITLGISAVMLTVFIIHIINVGKYNDEWRSITPGSTATQVLVDVHPRGGVTDSWVKVDTGLDTDLNAKIYELVVTNNAHTEVEDWNLRINISETCYLNNGWCGSFEIHQYNSDGNELVQTVDLRNFDPASLTVGYHQAGQDLLIPLKRGDYFIYHPDTSDATGEIPIKGNAELSGSAICGIIIYSVSGDVDFSYY